MYVFRHVVIQDERVSGFDESKPLLTD